MTPHLTLIKFIITSSNLKGDAAYCCITFISLFSYSIVHLPPFFNSPKRISSTSRDLISLSITLIISLAPYSSSLNLSSFPLTYPLIN